MTFPRLEEYVASLPHGLDSLPQCRTKASVPRAMLAKRPLVADLPGLPRQVREFLASPPIPSLWIPTVVANAVELAIADATCKSDAEFVELSRRMNVGLLSSPMYKPLLLLTPGFLLKMSTKTWSRFHEGSTLSAEISKRGAKATLTFARGLHPRLILLEKGTSMHAALEVAGAKNIEVRLMKVEPDRAEYEAEWT